MLLKELLEQRNMKELFLMLEKRKFPVPGIESKSDVQKVRNAYFQRNELGEEYFLRHLDDFEAGNTILNEDLSKYSKKDQKVIREYEEDLLNTGRLLREARRRKGEWAGLIAASLLDPDAFRLFYLSLSSEPAAFLNQVCSGQIQPDVDGKWPLSVRREEKNIFLRCEETGYFTLIKIPPEKTEDEREKITSVIIADDLLPLIRECITPDLEQEQVLRSLLRKIVDFSVSYYEIVPFSLLHKLYAQYQEQYPLQYPEMSLSAFEERIGPEIERMSYDTFIYKGISYVANNVDPQVTDDATPEDNYCVDMIQYAKRLPYDYYIPDTAEIDEYDKWYYWPSREPFRKLRAFFEGFYLDEKSIEDMTSGMWNVLTADEVSRKSRYPMDLVDENVSERLSEAVMMLMSGQETEDILHENQQIVLSIRESAKQEFICLLAQCGDLANQPRLLGHTPRHLREMGYDTDADE